MKMNEINTVTKSNSVVAINLFRLIINILFTDDSLSYHNNRQFSAKDRDNDGWPPHNCAEERHGAFWYNDGQNSFKTCAYANLNGEYLRNGTTSGISVFWWHWKRSVYSVKRVEMKIKPN